MDYREGARRIISAEEAAGRTQSEPLHTLIERRAVEMARTSLRKDALIADFDRLRLPDRLAALNTQVWNGLGRVIDSSGDIPSSNNIFRRTIELRAEIPQYVPDLAPIRRLGIVHIHKGGGGSGTGTLEDFGRKDYHGDGRNTIGMKTVAQKITGAKVDHVKPTNLTIEIESPTQLRDPDDNTLRFAPIPEEKGILRVYDTESESYLLKDLADNKHGIRESFGLVDLPPLTYMRPAHITKGYDLVFPPVGYDLEALSRIIDAALILSSIPILGNPLPNRMAQAEAQKAKIIARIGEKVPYPFA